MKRDYDLIVIGAGPGGTPAAMAAAKFGKKVLLVDKREAPGGECLFEGCIPSKVLENAANRYADVVEAKLFNVELSGATQIHWERVLEDKDMIVKKRSMGAMQQIEMLPTLEYKQGMASFVDAHSMKIGDKVVSFEKALIATGAKSFFPNIAGNGLEHVWTNRDVFFNEEIPKELLFIGAGAISCELAQMFNKLGVKCHILERSSRILKHVGTDAALAVQENMRKKGITIELNVTLEKIDFQNNNFSIYFTQNSEEIVLNYEHVIMATGRGANLDELNLQKADVAFDKHGVIVNDKLQSSQEHIYAAGDCINAPKFAHTASYEAGIVTHNMFAPSPHFVNYDKNSWVLFSDPQIGVVGLNEESAKSKNIDIDVAVYDFKTDARAQIDKKTDGYVKFIINKNTQVIIGVEIVSEDASALIGEASLIVANEMSAMDVMKAIHPHPTLTESFAKLAQQIFFKNMMKRG
ncbi:dihydrolipoyl dehydrogenase family protein [Sulfurimonas sp.]